MTDVAVPAADAADAHAPDSSSSLTPTSAVTAVPASPSAGAGGSTTTSRTSTPTHSRTSSRVLASSPSFARPNTLNSMLADSVTNYTIHETLACIARDSTALAQSFQSMLASMDERNEKYQQLTLEYMRALHSSADACHGSVSVMTSTGREFMRQCVTLEAELQRSREVEDQVLRVHQQVDWLARMVHELFPSNSTGSD